MSVPELSEDPRGWPNDPFELLGVPRGAADVDIKRAYGRLLRRFKPEHHPEQFRLIRDAYEACLQQAAWFRYDEGTSDPVPPEPVSRELPQRSELLDEADRLWALAGTGPGTEAYAGLTELARSHPNRPDLPLRLYWLLTLSPELDPGVSRHEWLAEGLARSRLSGPAAELYRRELEADPAIGLSGVYAGLLTVPAETRDLLTVAQWRAAAAGRAELYHPLEGDLKALRGRLSGRDEGGWLALVVAAAGWSTFGSDRELYDLCSYELASLRHLELSHAYYFDWLDETGLVMKAVEEARGQLIPDAVIAVGWGAWMERGAVPPGAVEEAAAVVVADPRQNLRRFDLLAQEIGPGFLSLVAVTFKRYLVGCKGREEPAFPPDLLRGLARRLTRGRQLYDYSWVRPDLLDALITEVVDPLELAEACSDDPYGRFRLLADQLRADVGLRVVWLAEQIQGR